MGNKQVKVRTVIPKNGVVDLTKEELDGLDDSYTNTSISLQDFIIEKKVVGDLIDFFPALFVLCETLGPHFEAPKGLPLWKCFHCKTSGFVIVGVKDPMLFRLTESLRLEDILYQHYCNAKDCVLCDVFNAPCNGPKLFLKLELYCYSYGFVSPQLTGIVGQYYPPHVRYDTITKGTCSPPVSLTISPLPKNKNNRNNVNLDSKRSKDVQSMRCSYRDKLSARRRRVGGKPELIASKPSYEGKNEYGVFPLIAFKRNDVIAEYLGEHISHKDMEIRDAMYRKCGIKSVFFMTVGKGQYIDPVMTWGIAKFINASCAPNCKVRQEGKHIFIIAQEDIPPMQELSIAYNLNPSNDTLKNRPSFYTTCIEPPSLSRDVQVARGIVGSLLWDMVQEIHDGPETLCTCGIGDCLTKDPRPKI